MPARKATKRAIKTQVSSITSRSSSAPILCKDNATSTSLSSDNGHSASDTPLADDTTADDIAMRLMAISLHDDGPDLDSMDTRLWKSREESLRDSRMNEVARDSPGEIPIDDILSGINKISMRSPSPERPPTLPRPKFSRSKRESDIRTKRVLKAFEYVEGKTRELSQALTEFMEAPSHEKFHDMHTTLSGLHGTMERNCRSTPTIDAKRAELVPRVRELDNRLQKARLLLPETDQPKEYPIDHHFMEPSVNNSTPVAQVALFLGVVCSVMFGVSRRAGDFIMSMLSVLLHLAFRKRDGSVNAAQESIRAEIPNRIEEALKRFNLDGRTTTYAMCPSCHMGYAPQFKGQSTIARYPDRCVNKILDHGVCGEALIGDKGPILPFVYQHLDDYIGKLLSQKETEQYLDSACDDLMESIAAKDQSTFIHDVFEAEFMKTFKGPEGEKLFIDRSGECRLAFSLCVDFFNTHGLRKRGPSSSSGIIAMACLNLPIEIRYKPEYMYLCGIIPGPRAPHGHPLNHYLTPLVDDLTASWQKGVFYRRTAMHSKGRIARAAVVCEVCDLLGARDLARLAHCTSKQHPCSVCQLTGGNLGNCEKDKWRYRGITEIRRIAASWRDAPTMKDQGKIYQEHGVAWTELYRLPYYDPTRQLTVDTMHCILEGLVQFHFRQVLKLTTADAHAKPVVPPAFTLFVRDPVPLDSHKRKSLPLRQQLDIISIRDVRRICAKLTKPILCDSPDAIPSADKLADYLKCQRKDAIQYVYEELDLGPFDEKTWERTKMEFISDLVQWRLSKPHEAVDKPAPKLTNPEVMRRIQTVIRTIDTPSWLESVPQNFGEKSAGTMKAAEWRVLSTVHIPIALVSLWGEGSIHETPDLAKFSRLALDHTMSLVSAVIICCYYSTSDTRLEAFLKYILDYNRDLTKIHKGTEHHPNHHMAVHLYDFLILFGPVRSWWTFPFERLIGHLQRLPSNQHIGQLESTLMRTVLRAGNLKRWLASPGCPEVLRQCRILFDRAFDIPVEDVEDEDTATASLVTTPADLHHLVNTDQVALQARLRNEGVIYARSTTHMGNSLILFYPGGSTLSSAVPGSIEYIFRTPNGCPSFAVHRQLPLSDGTPDPFRHYPHFPAQLYSSSLAPGLELVHVDWVQAHFARWQFSDSHAVVLSLSRD